MSTLSFVESTISLSLSKINAKYLFVTSSYNAIAVISLSPSLMFGNPSSVSTSISKNTIRCPIDDSSESSYASINNPTFTGNVTASSISIGGVDTGSLYQPRFQIAGYIVGSTVTVGGSYGTKTFTVARTSGVSQGGYTITFSSIGSTTYAVIGGIRNGTGSISYNGTAAGSVNIQTYNLAGTQTDLTFNFYILQ